MEFDSFVLARIHLTADIRFHNHEHDELVFEAATDEVEPVREQICRLMSEAAQLSIPLLVEAGVGNHWDGPHYDVPPLSVALGSIAVGPQQGQKAFMIRTIQPLNGQDPGLERVAKANGFSLHAGVNCEGHQKDKRERLCRYIARPAVAIPRLSFSSTGKGCCVLPLRNERV